MRSRCCNDGSVQYGAKFGSALGVTPRLLVKFRPASSSCQPDCVYGQADRAEKRPLLKQVQTLLAEPIPHPGPHRLGRGGIPPDFGPRHTTQSTVRGLELLQSVLVTRIPHEEPAVSKIRDATVSSRPKPLLLGLPLPRSHVDGTSRLRGCRIIGSEKGGKHRPWPRGQSCSVQSRLSAGDGTLRFF